MGGSSGKAADVKGAAEEQGEQARWLNREQTIANRPNQHNAWGSTTWERTPINYGGQQSQVDMSKYNAPQFTGRNAQLQADKHRENWIAEEQAKLGEDGSFEIGDGGPPMYEWTQIETLNPELQASLDAQFATQRERSELAESLMSQHAEKYGTMHDFDQYGDPIAFDPAAQRQAAEDAAYQRSTNRLDPQFDSQRKQLEIQLRNRGLKAGDAMYEAELSRFDRGRNDAYEQARLGATSEGRAEVGVGLDMNERANALRSQQIKEDLFARGYTLDEVNRLLEGQEIEGSTPSSTDATTKADISA